MSFFLLLLFLFVVGGSLLLSGLQNIGTQDGRNATLIGGILVLAGVAEVYRRLRRTD